MVRSLFAEVRQESLLQNRPCPVSGLTTGEVDLDSTAGWREPGKGIAKVPMPKAQQRHQAGDWAADLRPPDGDLRFAAYRYD